MATVAITTDDIFKNLYDSCDGREVDHVDTLGDADNVVLRNGVTGETRVIDSYENFTKLLTLMTNTQTDTNEPVACVWAHDSVVIEPHDWCAQQNIFCMFVCPFVRAEDYDRVKSTICFDGFVVSNVTGYADKCVRAGDYYYWPNMAVIYCGWSIYLKKQFDVDIGTEIPLVHNRRLGNVNLFLYNPEDFLNVELSLSCGDRMLFVNGRSTFCPDKDDDLFIITMTDESVSRCKIKPELVYSNKNFFDYIKDDINIKKCVTADQYKSLLHVNLDSLRVFEDKALPSTAVVTKEKLKVFRNITPSSENIDLMQRHIGECINLMKERMIEVMAQTDQADRTILQSYFKKSNFVNFDYIIVVLWRTISKNEELNLTKTDIKLFFELLCECIFGNKGPDYEVAKQRCEPYCKLTPKVFLRFCNHWTMFINENPCATLAYYYAIHFMIFCKHGTWDYSYENAKTCGVTSEVLCAGFFKKIVSSGNMAFVFNGKHYVLVRKDDDLFKLTEDCSGISMPSIKFNNWKYMYFTEEGVYNLFINDYHNGCPFIMGNTLLKALTRKDEKTYLPERVIQFMLDNGKNENEIYKIYHMAKVCREIKRVKNNMSAILAFNNCSACKDREQRTLNDLFREIWSYTHHELIVIGVYLNDKKMSDLIMNLKCHECKERSVRAKKCSCLDKLEIDVRAFKIVLIMELFSNSKGLLELMWSLLYTSQLYSTVLKTSVLSSSHCKQTADLVIEHADYFHANRSKIIHYLYNRLDRIDFVDAFVSALTCPNLFLTQLKEFIESNEDSAYEDDEEQNASDSSQCESTHDKRVAYIDHFYYNYYTTLTMLKKWNVWWDKLIVKRHNDDLNTWLTRFYMRIFMTKLNLQEYSSLFVKQIVMGYLYFRQFTNFNYINSLVTMHFGAGTGIPTDYEKCCLYLNGKPGSGKSSFFAVFDHFVVVHKHDSAKYTLTKKDTNEMEADKMISQLYVINEMKVCDDSFFKSTADSTKSNTVCRKYEGSQKYEGNFKLMIVNNKPLHISDYDKGVRNRFAVIYTDHLFEENTSFNGSIYWHIKNKTFPMEKSYIDELAKPVRLFLSHILMYKRNARDGYVSYKTFLEKDPVHNHNLMCLDVNNSPLNALLYVLKVNVKPGAKMVDESKIEKMIELAVPYVETMLHDLLVTKRTNVAQRTAMLFDAFKRKFKKYYREHEKVFYNIDMAWNKTDFNINQPEFIC
ncbi:DNA helicase [Agrotis ipsilon multiple nucleopolyhedrovirus]|uniref:DNA helicase n=1 Tax=Agrotis ipsilon multiple nucleopolyhedrovirus TaxID=208013 RepID=B6D600_9ABAC|nr:DNA helicase [Agrotis ipsilon multiple nucleopolyhedrovirus]ACI28787.1 DNA helicase [Agrotis ipsilon multiple nucleopolyhedrovirus]